MKIKINTKKLLVFIGLFSALSLAFLSPSPAFAKHGAGQPHCGEGSNQVNLSIDVGCRGEGNPIMDMLKAFTRFLSAGVGLVVVLMIIIAGIQYTTSSGNPQALAAAKGRLANAIIALLIFIFSFAILQFLIPGGLVDL